MEHKPYQSLLLTRICSFVIVISPIFAHYGFFFGFLLFPEMVYISLIPFCLIQKVRINLWRYKFLIIYLVMIFLLSMISGLIHNDFSIYEFATAYFRFLLYSIIIIIIADKFFDISYGAKAYLFFAFLNSLYLIAQFFSYKWFQIILPWYIKGAPIITGSKLISNQLSIFRTYGYRPQGFFLEPAYFASYVIPALAIILFFRSPSFQIKKIVKIIVSLVLTTALILSGSGTAIILLAVCWLLWGFNYLKENSPHKFALKILVISVAVALISILIYRTPYVTKSINRVLNTSSLSSGNVRIIQGFVVFNQLPKNVKVIGVGYGNTQVSIDKYQITTPHDIMGFSYINAIATILIGTGYLGLFFYLLIYFDLFIKTRRFFRYLTIILLMTAFSSEYPLSLSIITAFAFIMKGYDQKYVTLLNNSNK